MDYEHDVALSFASEQRWYVDVVARCLLDAGVKVFYDEFETAALWGRDGIEIFADVYGKKAYRVVMFISEHYVAKAWPTVERRASLSRVLIDPNANHIIPVRFDDVEVPGLSPQRLYQRAYDVTPMQLADLVVRHLVDSGRCSNELLVRTGRATEQARLVAFSSLTSFVEGGPSTVNYRIHNGSASAIDGVVVVVVDPASTEPASADNQAGCAMEMVIGTVGAGQTIEDSFEVELKGEPAFVALPYLATLLWSDADDNHWAACGTELRRRVCRARTC